jgi:hypothetical protein
MNSPGGSTTNGRIGAVEVATTVVGRRLRLYVAGSTPNSARAEKNLTAALEALDGEARVFEREVIDVLVHSKQAMLDGVIVTPTLIGLGSKGPLTMIGDLTNTVELMRLLLKLGEPGVG